MITLNDSPLRGLEKTITERLCAHVPRSIGTKKITFLGLLSSAGVFASYCLCERSRLFLFLVSFFIIAEWIFDCLDGAIGRARDEGFVRWGYYMDHLFDYFFLASIILGIYLLFPASGFQVLLLFFIASSYMMAFFLAHGASGTPEFRISFRGFSPIEFRIFVIIFNTALYFKRGPIESFVSKYLLFFNIFLLLLLAVIIYSNQKELDGQDRQ